MESNDFHIKLDNIKKEITTPYWESRQSRTDIRRFCNFWTSVLQNEEERILGFIKKSEVYTTKPYINYGNVISGFYLQLTEDDYKTFKSIEIYSNDTKIYDINKETIEIIRSFLPDIIKTENQDQNILKIHISRGFISVDNPLFVKGKMHFVINIENASNALIYIKHYKMKEEWFTKTKNKVFECHIRQYQYGKFMVNSANVNNPLKIQFNRTIHHMLLILPNEQELINGLRLKIRNYELIFDDEYLSSHVVACFDGKYVYHIQLTGSGLFANKFIANDCIVIRNDFQIYFSIISENMDDSTNIEGEILLISPNMVVVHEDNSVLSIAY